MLNIQYNTVTQIQQEQIKPGLSYSDALKRRINQEPNITYPRKSRENANNSLNTNNLLTKFLEEFKAMFQQLAQQNSMILNMLSTLI
jgi:hypothetical protein